MASKGDKHPSSRESVPASMITLFLDEIVDRMQTESPYFHIQALGSMGYHFCYLGTAQMNMLCVPLVWFGNSSLAWVIKPSPYDDDGFIFSNLVTDMASNSSLGQSTYMNMGTAISGKTDNNYVVMLGPPKTFYLEADFTKKNIAIYTYVDQHKKQKLYLKPVADGVGQNIIAMVEVGDKDQPPYVFQFSPHTPQTYAHDKITLPEGVPLAKQSIVPEVPYWPKQDTMPEDSFWPKQDIVLEDSQSPQQDTISESTLRGQVDSQNGEIAFATLRVLEPKEAAFEDGGNEQQITGIFSAPPMNSIVQADPVYFTIDNFKNWLTTGSSPPPGKIEVIGISTGSTYCYLDTTDMTMRYQTNPPIVDGNLALQWVQTAEPKTQGGVYFSNKVTEEATNALLNIGTVILESQTQSRYVVVEGPKTQVFYFKGDPKDGTKMAIYTKYDGTDYYLEPSDHDTHKEIIAVPEDKRKYKYPFKFPS